MIRSFFRKAQYLEGSISQLLGVLHVTGPITRSWHVVTHESAAGGDYNQHLISSSAFDELLNAPPGKDIANLWL